MQTTQNTLTLRQSQLTIMSAVVAVLLGSAPAAAQSGAKSQAAAALAPDVQTLQAELGGNVIAGGKLAVPPTPTFEGDIVRTESRPGSGESLDSGLQFRIAKLDAPAVTWVPAPSHVVLQVGDRLLLEVADETPHLVTWSGALEIDFTASTSRAEVVATTPGLQLVQATLVTPLGRVLGTARLVLVIDAPAVADPGLHGSAALQPLATPSCRLSAAAIVPGITSTFIAVVPICNMGSQATTFSFAVSATAPAGMSWNATAPDDIQLAVGGCDTVYVTFSLSDIDVAPQGGGPEGDASATLTLHSFSPAGPAALSGSHGLPACSVQLLDVCLSCLPD